MSDKPNNPPAFPGMPVEMEGQWCAGHSGMTLRDYFAAKAMVGCLAARNGFLVDVGTDNVAPWAYKIADAMLEARQSD